MKEKTWLVAAIGLASLIVLIALAMDAASRRAEDIYAELNRLNAYHRDVDDRLRSLRSDVNLSAIFLRDYLLDIAPERGPAYRERLAEFRRTSLDQLAELEKLVGGNGGVVSLRTRLGEYWTAMDPMFEWTAPQRTGQSRSFLQSEVVPRREAVLAMTGEIRALNDNNLVAERAEITRRHAQFRNDLNWLRWETILVGLAVAIVVVLRLRILEDRWSHAEQQMRALSQQIVQAQEDERRHLSRELHDHVAQVLTGLRMELGRVERTGVGAGLGAAVGECRRLVDEMFQTVRNLALGLRPSMLDDFGLPAALEWLVRDFMRRSATPVALNITGTFDALTDTQRTCVYRIVQEALTNCARHAGAGEIVIDVRANDATIHVTVTDDGVGFDPQSRRAGLGLRGIDERVRELGGTLTVSRGADCGTVLDVRLPMSQSGNEVSRARVAG